LNIEGLTTEEPYVRHFHLDNTEDYWALFANSADKNRLITEISLFANHDFGTRSSDMMDYQQAAMQFLKDFIEKVCAQQADVF
jgi:hypothetical protein